MTKESVKDRSGAGAPDTRIPLVGADGKVVDKNGNDLSLEKELDIDAERERMKKDLKENMPPTREEQIAFKKKAGDGFEAIKKKLLVSYKQAEGMELVDTAFHLFSAFVVVMELEAMFFRPSEIKSVSSTAILKSRLNVELPSEIRKIPMSEMMVDSLRADMAIWSVELTKWSSEYGHPHMAGFITSMMNSVNLARVSSFYELYNPKLV